MTSPPRTFPKRHTSCTVPLVVAAAGIMMPPWARRHSCMAFQNVIRGGHLGLPTNNIGQPHNNNDALARFSSSSNDDDDGGDFSDDDVGGGEELAGKFYDQLRRREMQEEKTSSPELKMGSSNEEETYILDDTNTPPLQRQRSTQKFTGRPSPPPPPPSSSSSPPSLFANDDRRRESSSAITRERQREFDLAGNFERTFGIQVAVLFVSIVFVASVGMSGGITDGSDRNFGGADDLLDGTVIERIERLRTDDAAEVLLREQPSMVQGSQWL